MTLENEEMLLVIPFRLKTDGDRDNGEHNFCSTFIYTVKRETKPNSSLIIIEIVTIYWILSLCGARDPNKHTSAQLGSPVCEIPSVTHFPMSHRSLALLTGNS